MSGYNVKFSFFIFDNHLQNIYPTKHIANYAKSLYWLPVTLLAKLNDPTTILKRYRKEHKAVFTLTPFNIKVRTKSKNEGKEK